MRRFHFAKSVAAAAMAGFALLAVAAHGAKVVEEPSGYELWGMRKRHVAVVNPVLGADPRWNMSMGGEWECMTNRYTPWRNAFWTRHQEKKNWGKTFKLRVPGLVETQGIGEPGISRPWDCFWDASPKPLRHVFAGAVWYRRSFRIPSEWSGRRIWLKIGNVTAQGWLWVNGTQVAWHESFCGTYKYEITDLVTPGKEALFVIEVTNEVAGRSGTRSSMNRWCGIPRALELEATPSAHIDDAWVRGDHDARCAEAHVEVDGAAGRPLKVRVTVEGKSAEADVAGDETVVRVPLTAFRAWSPECPNLYTARVDLVENGKVLQTRRERFGARKLEVRGADLYLNGRPFFVRGIGYHNIQPVYGNDRIGDRDYRRFEVGKMRAAGFNFLRTHTRCETPEFFDACDELGMMVQPEMPYYTDHTCEKFEFNPVRDAKEMFVHMRRHPSFAVYSHGNEGTFGPALGKHMYRLIKEMDKDRLVLDQDNPWTKNWPRCYPVNGKGECDFVGGPTMEWERGSVRPDRPMVCHEYLNLSVKANADLEDRYTGIWQTPFGRAKRREWLAKSGLSERWGSRLQLAQHALQAYWFKHGIECARADPWCDGYYYWSAQDCTSPQGENYTAQGLFDPFWGDKPSGHTAASVAVFNGPSCLLCDAKGKEDAPIFVSGDTVAREVLFANYGDAPLADARLSWSLRASDGRVLASGEKGIGNVPLGGVRKVADVSFAVPELDKACRCSFEVRLGSVSNAWDMWLFPRRSPRDAAGVGVAASLAGRLASRYTNLSPVETARVVIAPADSPEAAAARARGATLIEIGPADGEPEVRLGWWWLGKQVGAVFADHPALKHLPHSGHLDPLFFRIFKAGRPLPVEGFGEDGLVVVSEGRDECSVHLAERRQGTRSEYLVHGLDVLADTPESCALLDGIVDAARAR